MTQTKYEDQKSNHMSWIQWINMNLDNAKEFYEEVKMNLREITSQIISRVGKELRFFISKLTSVDFFCGSVTLGIMAFASLFLAFGFGLVGYQVFLWIKDGVWSEFATMEVFNFLFENTLIAQWLDNPESWFGLQKITEWLLYNIPVSVALIVPSIMVLVGMMCVSIVALILRFYQFKSEENI
ncbi:MAG: hypothetical protein HOD16_06425 [Nitrospina sp.]|jgi:hypothetical protein|nr:hypothetical protein [Nitrospina sp.]